MEYTTIKLPNDLVTKIDAFIEHSDDGYTSRTDVIKHAVREFFREHKFNNGNKDGE